MQPIFGLVVAILFSILLFLAWDQPSLVWWSLAFVGAVLAAFGFVGRGQGDLA